MNKAGILAHKKAFDAWLRGEKIEYYSPSDGRWIEVSDPAWFESSRYRIKPKVGVQQIGQYIMVKDTDASRWYKRILLYIDDDGYHTLPSESRWKDSLHVIDKQVWRQADFVN